MPKTLALGKLAERYKDPALLQILQEIASRSEQVLRQTEVGRAVLAAGTVLIFSKIIQVDSVVLLSYETLGGTPGRLSSPKNLRRANASFSITSDSATDTSTVVYLIWNP